jgi:hypothetical protein
VNEIEIGRADQEGRFSHLIHVIPEFDVASTPTLLARRAPTKTVVGSYIRLCRAVKSQSVLVRLMLSPSRDAAGTSQPGQRRRTAVLQSDCSDNRRRHHTSSYATGGWGSTRYTKVSGWTERPCINTTQVGFIQCAM